MKKRLAKLNKLTYQKPKKPTAGFALISQAARETPYSGEYLSLLVRKGKIAGRKFGRNWHVAKKDLEKYLTERQAQQMQSYRPVVTLANVPLSPLTPVIPIEGVKRDEKGEMGKPEQDLATDIKKELDELEELYQARMNADGTRSNAEENHISTVGPISSVHPRFAFPKLPQGEIRGVKGERGRNAVRWAEIAIVSIITLVIILGGFNLKFANALYGAVKDFVQDAMTLQGHVPGTHANEILLLDKEGKISIYGHIETQGQFRSYAKDGIAPIVVDSKTTAENLSADYLDGISAQEFTLQLVTKNGNITFDNVKLEGGAEVGKLLLVKGAAQFLDYVSVAKNLSVGGSVSVGQDLVVNGVSTLAGKIQALGGALFTGRVEVKGDIDATGFIAAQRAQIKEGGLMVSGSTQLNTLGVTGGASMSDLGISGNFSVAGKEISLGDSGADKLTITASSTFSGPFLVSANEAKFGRGIEILANGLTVAGATGITGNTTVTGNLTVSGSSSWGVGLGIGTSTPGAALGVKGGIIADGFVSANYFTSTSSLTSWLMGSMGIGTTTPSVRLGVEGDAIIKGGLYAQATTTTSSLIATSTLEVRGASGNDLVVFDGNVGIGTSTPGNLFSVHGNANIQNNLIVEGDSVFKGNFKFKKNATTTADGGIEAAGLASSQGLTLTGGEAIISGTLNVDGTGNSYIMGNLGVGTSTPGSLFSVHGVGNIGELTVEGLFKGGTLTATSSVIAALGSVSFPSYTFLGDTNTGLWSSAADTLNFSTAGSERFRVNSNGNLGVGTSSPGTMLAVDGDISVDGFYAMGTTTTSSLIATSTLEVRGATGNDFFVGDGRVGLGSTTPNATQVISNDASNSAADLLQLVNSVGTYNFVVTNGGSVGIGMYNPSGYLTVYGNTYLAATEGNVGIGETSPGSKLSVSGNATIGANIDTRAAPTNGLYVEGDVLIGTAGTGVTQAGDVSIFGGDINLGYGFASSTLTSLHGRLGIYDTSQASTSPGAILSVHAATTVPAFLINQTGTGEGLTIQDSGVTALVLRDGALLGIATSSPGYRFASEGDGLFKGGLYVQATSTMSSLIATSTLEVRSSAYTGGLLLAAFKEKVGFGTSTPGSLLSVHGNANIGELTVEGQFKAGFITATSTTNNTFAGALDVTESATSTFTGGVNVSTTGGLSSATGLTITGGDILSSGKLTLTGASTSTIPQLNASTILTVPTLDISTILKNSGTATSSFAGGLSVGTGGLNVTSGGLYVDVGDVTFDQKLVVNGNVGIGTTNPSSALLQVQKSNVGDDTLMMVYNTDNSNSASKARIQARVGGTSAGDPIFQTYDGTNAWTFGHDESDSQKFKISSGTALGTNDYLTITSAGNVGIGDATPEGVLDVDIGDNLAEDGNVCITVDNVFSDETDGVCDSSSIKVKTDITNIEYGINDVMNLRPVLFRYKKEFKPDFQILRAGFIAEEMHTIIPEVVTYDSYDENGLVNGDPDGIDYGKLTAVLTKVLQDREHIVSLSLAPTTTPSMVIDANGNVGIGSTTPAYKLAVAGDVGATAFINISTAASKKDIDYLDVEEEKNVLEKIRGTRVATYQYNMESSANPKRLGLIAEEAPAEVLSIDGKGVDIYKLSSFILAGVKAQQLQIDQLTQDVAVIKSTLSSLNIPLSPSQAPSTNTQITNNTQNSIFKQIFTVAKSALASLASSMSDWANGVLAATTKLKVDSENSSDVSYETYSVLSSREEITASGSATLQGLTSEGGQTLTGARVRFDESFVAAISETEPVKVIITPTTRLNGALYVHQKSRFGFEAREVNAQDEGGMFDWLVIARKKGGEDAAPISPIGPIGPIEEPAPAPVVEEAPPADSTSSPPAEEVVAPPAETVTPPAETVTPPPAEEPAPVVAPPAEEVVTPPAEEVPPVENGI